MHDSSLPGKRGSKTILQVRKQFYKGGRKELVTGSAENASKTCVRGGSVGWLFASPSHIEVTYKVQQVAFDCCGSKAVALSKFLSWSALKGATSLAS